MLAFRVVGARLDEMWWVVGRGVLDDDAFVAAFVVISCAFVLAL